MFFKTITLCALFVALPHVVDNYRIVRSTPQNSRRSFKPVTEDWQRNICARSNDMFQFIQATVPRRVSKPLTRPTVTIDVVGDGNCFFSALAKWLTGSFQCSGSLRDILVNFIRGSQIARTLFDGNPTVTLDQHLHNMAINGTFATEVELYAAAEMLGTSIYVYSRNEWQLFSKDGVQGIATDEPSLYLKHTNGNHFDIVVDVY
ncbi:uncharacterized protein LOC126838087 isoform X2 [Adelges cooleyi]|uniref:uncharacterized protein LOC126838087 isoform X2 n=1 Tax=Adelges cooleyi TaxID=133065 RepID=UPI00217F678A|nr:uncharacterized protein LOC126838087 isoform X2 [Adelges cooleyi]